MRIRKLDLRSGFFSRLGYLVTAEAAPQPLRLEAVRHAMLATLGDTGCEQHAQVERKLRRAGDAMTLWYTRSDLMAALARMHGETCARQEMERLSTLFHGLLPPGMTLDKPRAPG